MTESVGTICPLVSYPSIHYRADLDLKTGLLHVGYSHIDNLVDLDMSMRTVVSRQGCLQEEQAFLLLQRTIGSRFSQKHSNGDEAAKGSLEGFKTFVRETCLPEFLDHSLQCFNGWQPAPPWTHSDSGRPIFYTVRPSPIPTEDGSGIRWRTGMDKGDLAYFDRKLTGRDDDGLHLAFEVFPTIATAYQRLPSAKPSSGARPLATFLSSLGPGSSLFGLSNTLLDGAEEARRRISSASVSMLSAANASLQSLSWSRSSGHVRRAPDLESGLMTSTLSEGSGYGD